jgi:hypothetical protein
MSLLDHPPFKSVTLKDTFLKVQMEQGFIVLEALIAMGLIAGIWLSMVQIYQELALRQIKVQAEKVQLRKDADAFELSEYTRSQIDGSVKHEPSRVLSRSRTMSGANQPTIKN